MSVLATPKQRLGLMVGLLVFVAAGYGIVEHSSERDLDRKQARLEAAVVPRIRDTPTGQLAAAHKGAAALGPVSMIIPGDDGSIVVAYWIENWWDSRCVYLRRTRNDRVEVHTRDGACR